MQKIGVMFVCLGNICRSPMAEAILLNKVKNTDLQNRFNIESCGTANYHVGELPDRRTLAALKRHNVPIDHFAQQLKSHHFNEFNYLIMMDDSNLQNALEVEPTGHKSNVFLMRDFDEEEKGSGVTDPWFGGEEGFEECYQVLSRSCESFLQFLVEKHNLKGN